MKRLLAALILASLAAAVFAAPAPASTSSRFFRTADDNIACAIVKGYKKKRRHGRVIPAAPGEARCDITSHVWTAPPPAKRCREDYGNGAFVTWKGPGHYLCAGDSVRSPSAPPLLPGQSIFLGWYGCTALESGMRCTNVRTGHGFELSAAAATLF